MKRTRTLTLLPLLLASLLLTAVSAGAIEIVYPAHKTWFHRSDFLIIKGGESPVIEAMTVDINGAKSDLLDISAADYRSAFGDFLILEPDFDPGKNKVTVEGYAGGKKVATAVADIYYLDGDPSAIPPSGYTRFVMHLPEKEKLCAGCHNMTPDKAQLGAQTEQANPCASCHRRMLAAEHVHGPAGVYGCADCHDAASKPAKYKVRESDAKLCNECHFDKVEEYKSNKFVHGPVGAGLCSACHDSHASPYGAQLHAPVNAVCTGCHDSVTKSPHVVRGFESKGHPLMGVRDPTNPGAELSCASCHDPHGGQGRAFFRRGITSRFALCGICHEK